MSAEAVEPSEATEGLRLSCGHLLTAVVTSSEGTSYCGACAELAGLVQDEPEADQPRVNSREEEVDSEPIAEAAEIVGTDPEAELEDAGPDVSLERQDGADDLLPQPVYGTRADAPGARGCWALKKDGTACGAVKRRDGDFCTAHSGQGVASDPRRYSPLAHEARRRQLETRAQLRMVLGDRGRVGPRAVLREEVYRESKRLVGTTIAAALDESGDPIKRANLAVRLIAEADPPSQTTLTVTAEQDLESLSLAQLIALSEQRGIDLSRPEPTPLETPPQLEQ